MPRYTQSAQDKVHAAILEAVVSSYTEYFRKILGCSDGNNHKYPSKKWTKDHHKFIPSSNIRGVIVCLRFVRDHLANIYKKKHNSSYYRSFEFLDCGCGIGNIMLLARAVSGYKVTGLEYEAEVCEVARILLPNNKIIQQDILTFEHYADYDVIYYYQPIVKEEKMRQFAEKVRNDIKVGAVVVTYGGGSGLLYRDKRFKAIFDNSKTIPENIRNMAHKKIRE